MVLAVNRNEGWELPDDAALRVNEIALATAEELKRAFDNEKGENMKVPESYMGMNRRHLVGRLRRGEVPAGEDPGSISGYLEEPGFPLRIIDGTWRLVTNLVKFVGEEKIDQKLGKYSGGKHALIDRIVGSRVGVRISEIEEEFPQWARTVSMANDLELDPYGLTSARLHIHERNGHLVAGSPFQILLPDLEEEEDEEEGLRDLADLAGCVEGVLEEMELTPEQKQTMIALAKATSEGRLVTDKDMQNTTKAQGSRLTTYVRNEVLVEKLRQHGIEIRFVQKANRKVFYLWMEGFPELGLEYKLENFEKEKTEIKGILEQITDKGAIKYQFIALIFKYNSAGDKPNMSDFKDNFIDRSEEYIKSLLGTQLHEYLAKLGLRLDFEFILGMKHYSLALAKGKESGF